MIPTVLAGLLATSLATQPAPPTEFEPNWESLETHPTPAWFEDGKFGIFIHWGVYSVPSFNIHNISKAIKDGYAGEWYWWYLHGLPTPEVIKFHNET